MVRLMIRQMMIGDVLGVVEEDRLRAGGAGGDQDGLQVLDVFHGLVQDPDLGHLLDRGGVGHVLPQGLEALVDNLHPPPLSLIPLDGLQILRRLDLVAVHRVEGHELRFGCHDVTKLLTNVHPLIASKRLRVSWEHWGYL